MDSNVVPVMVITNAEASLQPWFPQAASGLSRCVHDTFTTPALSIVSGMDGRADVLVSAARDVAGRQCSTHNIARLLIVATPPGSAGSRRAVPVGAAITWRTDKPATTRVEYGLTAAYGSFSPLFTELYPIHAVNLSQLQPATTYHFRVLSRDEYGIEGVSQDYTFTTLNDTAPPNTSFAGGPADNSFVCQLPAVFQFSGSDDATPATSLEFAYQIDDGPWSAFGTPSATVTGLSEGWHVIRARARDQAGNVDASPTVRNFHISTDGPTLSGVTATPGPGSFTIRWETVEPSTSQVEYGSSASYGSQTPVGSPWSPSRVTVTGLEPSTTFHFRVRSSDTCNQSTVSADGTVVTGPAPDLLITRVEIPAEVWTGGSFDVAWTITNRGTANITGEWRDSVYLCSGSQPCTTYLLGDFRYTAGLNATSAVTRVQSMTIDRTRVTEGPYYVTVIADGRNDVFEGLPNSPAEQNNSAVSSAPASVRLTPLPDLVVNTVTAPANDVSVARR